MYFRSVPRSRCLARLDAATVQACQYGDEGGVDECLHQTHVNAVGPDTLIGVLPPDLLQSEIPQTTSSKKTVIDGREEAVAVVNGTDLKQRVLVIIGPCSIHDPKAALEYCDWLLKQNQ